MTVSLVPPNTEFSVDGLSSLTCSQCTLLAFDGHKKIKNGARDYQARICFFPVIGEM